MFECIIHGIPFTESKWTRKKSKLARILRTKETDISTIIFRF